MTNMSKYIDVDKLIAEIERWRDKAKEKYNESTYSMGRCDALAEFRNHIDSLQEEQPIQVNTLTWRDINDIERIINNVHYEFRAGIGEKSFGEEVLERFREERDEQEQPEVELEKEIKRYQEHYILVRGKGLSLDWMDIETTARHFYELGLKAKK